MADNVLDKYRVIAQLGRGGMADVFLAASHGLGGFSKLLVVKVLQPALARDHQFLRMFLDEARLAARLNHPNVVQTYEVGHFEGRHYIAMEYLEGQALNRVVERFTSSGGLTPALALRIAIDALAGLHYAHELCDFDGRPLGVVHRDITPQNVFVTYEGQVKLVDFGIAKAFDSTTETTVGTVKGKVAYMAPEQARGEVVDRRADIFSMGVVLWELLSGRRLWEGLTDIAVIGRLVQGDIPDIGKLRPDVPPGLARACMKALHADPKLRPQTALELSRELELQLDELSSRLAPRRVGELVALAFEGERAQVRSVVKKQLERLARTTPTGVTPAGGWRLASAKAGDMPILGEGSAVHDAVTALHTGLTGPRTSAGADTRSRKAAAPRASERPFASVNDAESTLNQARNRFYVAAGIGALGVVVGITQPWRYLPTPPADRSGEHGNEKGAAQKPAAGSSLAASKGAPGDCDAPHKPRVELTGEIDQDAELTCDKEYLLRFTTFVKNGATLKIQPGTVLRGDLNTRGTLVIQPGGRIDAPGTAERPIVFTSAAPAGQQKPGDWGGVILLGRAPINLRDGAGRPMEGEIEGIPDGGEYGGSNPDDSSGVLRYVRIEYSGTEIAPNNEINGVTFGGVGRGTIVDHVQVRHTGDDCFEFFGGTVDAKYLVCQAPGDDAFDWDYGYRGRLQFLVAQAEPKLNAGANGLEGDNDPGASNNEPVSDPTIYNLTLCGKNQEFDKEHYGMLLRRGTHCTVRNGIFVGFSGGLDVRDANTRPVLASNVFYRNLAYNLAFPELAQSKGMRVDKEMLDDDRGFDEQAFLMAPNLKNRETDPKLGNCFDERAPGFKPVTPIAENASAPPDDGFFDTSARYVGAFRDRNDGWDQGKWLTWAE